MKPLVTVIDYGVGNLLSVARAFEHCGAEVLLTESPDIILDAERLVLPGVGAFKDGMEELKARNLIDPIKQYATLGRPFLGICLGMQMMLDSSEEFGDFAGLGLIPGKVIEIARTGLDGKPHKIPHIGWSPLIKPSHNVGWGNSILSDVAVDSTVYFVHSFTANLKHEDNRLADCLYNGRIISAAIKSGSLYGCQFHPEKSGDVGLKIIQSFITV